MEDFIERLKQRKLVQWALAYAAAAFALIQVLDIVAQRFGWPDIVERFIIVAMAVGFFVTLVLAWYHGERGVQKTTSTELLILALLLVIGGVVAWRLAPAPATTQETATKSATVIGPASAIPDKSIAVLPLVNESGDPQQDYFSDGLSEELIAALAQIHDLKVIARNSSFKFRGKQQDDTVGIGTKLGVATLLTGTVRKQGNQIRIVTSLVKASDGSELWSQTYDRELTDIFKVQDEISNAVAHALETRIAGHDMPDSAARPTNPAAFDAYLQGRAFIAKRYLDNLDQAIAAFDRAIALDPGYSAAYSGRAFAQLLRPLWGATDVSASFIRARDSANKALQFDTDNAEAYMVRGVAAYFDRNATSAGIDLGHALTLAPGNVDVLNMKGDFHANLGDLGEAERLKRKAMALDPLAFVHPMNLSDVLSDQGQYPEAIVAAQQAIALGAKDYGFDRLVFAQVRSGHFKEARVAMEQGCAITGPTGNNCGYNQILLLAAAGQRAQAESMLDALVRDIRSGKHPAEFYTPAVLASLYCEVSNFAKAAILQRQALDTPDFLLLASLISAPGGTRLPEEISTNPDWLAVWNDPRMKDLMSVYRHNVLAWRASRR
ncbi:MAG: hypothetical protein ABI365_06695 [Lysobacteraceae bacterium]